MIEPATELHERVLSKIDSEYLSNHDKLLCDDIIATVKKTVAECIAEIDSLELVDHNGTPMEEVVHHLMVLKCNIRERFGIELVKTPVKKECAQKVNGHCPLHNLFCQYPECEK